MKKIKYIYILGLGFFINTVNAQVIEIGTPTINGIAVPQITPGYSISTNLQTGEKTTAITPIPGLTIKSSNPTTETKEIQQPKQAVDATLEQPKKSDELAKLNQQIEKMTNDAIKNSNNAINAEATKPVEKKVGQVPFELKNNTTSDVKFFNSTTLNDIEKNAKEKLNKDYQKFLTK